MKQKYNVFCDLDGVLADFNLGYEMLTGIDISKHSYKLTDKEKTEFFKPIDVGGKEFWVNLNWTKDGKELWSYIKKYNPQLLSAPTRHHSSIVGKHEWVSRELPNVNLILRSTKNKKEFASENSILIDDRESNVEDWIENNGIGILHKTTNSTINELKKLGL